MNRKGASESPGALTRSQLALRILISSLVWFSFLLPDATFVLYLAQIGAQPERFKEMMSILFGISVVAEPLGTTTEIPKIPFTGLHGPVCLLAAPAPPSASESGRARP